MQIPASVKVKRDGQAIGMILGALERTESGLLLYSMQDGMLVGDVCEIAGDMFVCDGTITNTAIGVPTIYQYILLPL